MPETDPILFELQRLRADVDELVRGEFSYNAAGTYTPTLTNVANIAASTAYACQYIRVGNVVTVSGQVDIDPTAAATYTELDISLPIASAFTATNQLGGVGTDYVVPCGVAADPANDRASLFFASSADVTNHSFWFTFTYQIL